MLLEVSFFGSVKLEKKIKNFKMDDLSRKGKNGAGEKERGSQQRKSLMGFYRRFALLLHEEEIKT